MPVSKKRKKKSGAVAKFKNDRHAIRRRQIELDIENGEHMSTGVSLQDLINMVAYQEAVAEGKINNVEIPDVKPPVYSAIDKIAESEENNEDGQ